MTKRFKVMLLGEIGVGKTSLVRRLVHDKFDGTYSGTLGFDIYTYRFTDPGRDVELMIWDTDGSVGAGVIRSDLYMAGTEGALVICDLMRPDTHASALQLAHDFEAARPGRDVVLVVNKSDLAAAPVVPSAFHASGRPVALASAKSGQQVRSSFELLAGSMLRRAS
jgi:small GTP-binding protein